MVSKEASSVWLPQVLMLYSGINKNTNMKKFVLVTHSESGDEYVYFIEHSKKPTVEQLKKWLVVNSNEDDYCYEQVSQIKEITTFQTL